MSSTLLDTPTTDSKKPLSRDAFLASAGELAQDDVEIKGLGVVRVKEMTGSERVRLLEVLAPAANGGKVDLGRYQEMILELCLVDPVDGGPLLDMASVKDVMKMGASKVQALLAACERVSGLSASADEDAEKNSLSGPTSASTSG